jgi:hypothetical protein
MTKHTRRSRIYENLQDSETSSAHKYNSYTYRCSVLYRSKAAVIEPAGVRTYFDGVAEGERQREDDEQEGE